MVQCAGMSDSKPKIAVSNPISCEKSSHGIITVIVITWWKPMANYQAEVTNVHHRTRHRKKKIVTYSPYNFYSNGQTSCCFKNMCLYRIPHFITHFELFDAPVSSTFTSHLCSSGSSPQCDTVLIGQCLLKNNFLLLSVKVTPWSLTLKCTTAVSGRGDFWKSCITAFLTACGPEITILAQG